ncbi:hypothetical protein [Caldimonas sp. KR1-144]|uniref:hypothetical protein n=1 Tax=Caldimonas sp. KR1-144 TaxID=3400911 RepID=UPI003C0A9167
MNKTRLGLAHTPVLSRRPAPPALPPKTTAVLGMARHGMPLQLELPFVRTGSAFVVNKFRTG